MTFNSNDPKRSAWRHRPALTAIAFALAAAALAFVVFSWLSGQEELEPAQTPAPATTPEMSPESANGETVPTTTTETVPATTAPATN